MTVAQSPSAAIRELGAIHRGEGATETVPAGPTFGDAFALHMDRLRRKGGRPRSISSLEDEARRHLSDWTTRRLADISRTDCRTLHERLTIDSGPYVAKPRHALRARRLQHRTQGVRPPANPTVAVHWNKEERRQEPIPWPNLL